MEKYPIKTDGIVYRNSNTFFGYCGWPSVCADENGVLYTAYSGFRGSHICPFGKTCLSRSHDGGKTWSVPLVVNDTWLDDRDAGIVCLGGNRLLITWFTNPADTYNNGAFSSGVWDVSRPLVSALYPNVPDEYSGGGSYYRISNDGGETWGDITKIPISSPHGPILRRDGSVFYLGKELWCHASRDTDHVVRAMESRDGGKTFTNLGAVPQPDGIAWNDLHEPYAIELPDGTLLGAIRAHKPYFTVFLTRSADGGKTWTVPEQTNIQGSPPHLLLHSSGAIIMTFGRRIPPFGERAAISHDGGKTWDTEYILRDDGVDGDLGYPCTSELSDGSLLTVYYQKLRGDKQNSILYTKWQLE
jgi:sialidase-1